MASWDFDFDQDEGFDNGLGESGSMFFSDPSFMDSSFPADRNPSSVEDKMVEEPQMMESVPNVRSFTSTTVPSSNLAEENNKLKQFFSSLKEKAEQAEMINQSLKEQLEDCRNWFKSAMFSGISNHK